MKYSTATKTLQNGIEILYIDVPGVTTFDLAVGIRSGYRFANRDNAELYELPHILEHMVFDGSRHYADYDSLESAFTVGGGTWNGMTNPYLNLFPFHNRAKNALSVIDAALDCVLFPKLTEQSFDEEMGVILSELEQGFGDFASNAAAYAQQLITPDYATSTDIQVARLENITLDAVKAYHKKYYTLKNMRIVVATDFKACSKAAIEKQILKTTHDAKPGKQQPFPAFTVAPAKPDEVRSEQISKGVEETIASFQFFKEGELGLKLSSELQLFVFLASSMKSYSVNHVLRKKGLIYGLELETMQSQEGYNIELSISANNDKFADVYAYTLGQLRDFAKNGITEKQFIAAKQEYIDSFEDAEASTDGIVGWYSLDFLMDEPVATVAELQQVFAKITQKEMLASVAELLQYDTLRAAVFSAKPVRAATAISVLTTEILKKGKVVDEKLIEENAFGVSTIDFFYKKIVAIFIAVFVVVYASPLLTGIPNFADTFLAEVTQDVDTFSLIGTSLLYSIFLASALFVYQGYQLRKSIMQMTSVLALLTGALILLTLDPVESLLTSSQIAVQLHAALSVGLPLAVWVAAVVSYVRSQRSMKKGRGAM